MRPFRPQRLVRRRRRRGGTSVGVVDVVFHMLVELLEEEGALKAHFCDCAVEPLYAEPRAVVVLLDVIDPSSEFDAFAIVGGFDGRG